MTTWTSDELRKISAAEELQIASMRKDGTLRNPVTIWVVRVGDDLYIRSVNGRDGAWYRNTQVRHEGRVRAGGVDKDVTFTGESNPKINADIDAAYRAQYRHYTDNNVNSILTPHARLATLKLTPK